MGCSASAPPMEHEQEALLKEKFHYNDDDMSQLYKAFQKIDLTKSNLIEFDEFCVRCKCEESLFLKSIFAFFSSKGLSHPVLTFPQFALFASFFLTLDETGLASYLYKVLTDAKFNPNLSKKELRTTAILEETILELFGKTWGKREKLHSLLHKMDKDHNGSISESEFVNNCLKNKSLMFPIVRYQLDLRGRILSHPFWTKREGMGNACLPKIVRTRNELNQMTTSDEPAEFNSLSSAMTHGVKEVETHGNRVNLDV